MQKKSTADDLRAKIYEQPEFRHKRLKRANRLYTIMKLTFIQLTVMMIFSGVSIAFTNHAQEILDRRVSLEIKGTSLTHALAIIEQAAGVKFVYSPAKIDLSEVVSIAVTDTKLGSLLGNLLTPRSIRFVVQGGGNYIVLVENGDHGLLPPVHGSQPGFEYLQRSISGKVSDSEGNPLPGVSIIVKGTTNGTTTNIDGGFSLTVADENDVVLVFSFIGYTTQEIAVAGRLAINVVLVPSLQTLDEIVVVGYATQKKINLTGAVQQLEGDELASQASIQTSAALMGKVAGVQVIQNSGQPGRNQGTIRIRGTGTLGNSNPLVLIDGIPGDLNNVPSGDIASLTVLKDAAAASVYGSRAANGVVLVTTKRGMTDQIEVSYSGFVGTASPTTQPEFVDGATFMQLQNLGAQNVGMAPLWSNNFIAGWEDNHLSDPDNYPSTDWVKEAFTEPGIQQRHALTVSGGTKNVRMLGSVSYDEENSKIPNYGFDRYSIRLNTDINATEKLDFKFDVNLIKTKEMSPSQGIGRILTDIYRVPAVYVSRYSHGGWGPAFNLHNPIAYIHDGGSTKLETLIARARMAIGYRFAEGLSADLTYSPDVQAANGKTMVKQYDISNSDGEVLQQIPGINSLTQDNATSFSQNLNAVIRFEKSISEHSFHVLAGYEYVTFNNSQFDAFRDQFQLQDFEQINAGSVANQRNNGTESEWALRSFFGRLNYSFDTRYLLEGNLRYDGSSRFNRENRWGVFPSFSAGWVISEEAFLEGVEFLETLKIRASWGLLGNQQIGTYPFVSTIDLGQGFVFGGGAVGGAAQLGLANPNITWEKTETSNVGVDVSLFGDQLNFSLDVFSRKTSDILLQLPVPLIMGLTAPFQNAGEVKNTGWEINMGYRGSLGESFTYGIGFNISDVKNTVTNLRGAGPFIDGNTIITEGAPISVIFGYESDGLFNSQEEIDAHAEQTGQIAPGDIRYVDQNNDGTINADDRVIIGDPFPSLTYGINLFAEYKGFDLSLLLQGIGRRDVYLSGYEAWPLYNGSNIRKWQAEDYWTPENPDASMPRFTPGSTHSNFTASDFWVFDASYLRLRNIQLGYKFLSGMGDKLPVKNFRVFVMGENLVTLFDKMPQGVDPNVPNGGSYFPINRLFTLGMNVTLR